MKCQTKLKSLEKKSSSLQSFSSFVEQGLSHKEMIVIDSICHVTFSYLEGLAGNIATDPFGWKMYMGNRVVKI